MRFQSASNSNRPPYFNRRDQWRLLRLVGLFSLVVILIQYASNPRNWRWMFPGGTTETQAPVEPSPKQLDYRVRFEGEGERLSSDAFRSRTSATAKETESDASTHPHADVAVDPALLSEVRDNYIGIRRAEADAYYALLAKADDLPLDRLEAAARENVSYTVLMHDPDLYRGELITIEGELRRLRPLADERNDHGVSGQWEAWIQTPDAPSNPWRAVVTSVPEGIPQGEWIDENARVRVTGYFFKREAYGSEGGFHAAPLLLGQRLRWFPQPPQGQGRPAAMNIVPYVGGFVLLIAAGLGLTLWRFRVSDRRFERSHLKRLTEPPPEEIAALNRIEP